MKAVRDAEIQEKINKEARDKEKLLLSKIAENKIENPVKYSEIYEKIDSVVNYEENSDQSEEVEYVIKDHPRDWVAIKA